MKPCFGLRTYFLLKNELFFVKVEKILIFSEKKNTNDVIKRAFMPSFEIIIAKCLKLIK